MKPHYKLSLDGSIQPVPRSTCDWHSADVISALHKADTSLRRLAHQHGYAHINDVLTRPWVAAELIVATALQTTPQAIWPSRYKRSRARAAALTRKPLAIKQHKATLRPNPTKGPAK